MSKMNIGRVREAGKSRTMSKGVERKEDKANEGN